jgi:Zn-dependent protease
MPYDKKARYDVVEPRYTVTYSYGPQAHNTRPRKLPFTSVTEIRDIAAAVAALTIAFFWMDYGYSGGSALYILSVAAVSVVVGFLLHEMSHKIVARGYGCWAEFRADYRMLGLALVMSIFGFLFAAPGAVMIAGNIDREQNGKISLAGPATNFIVAIALLPAAFFTFSGIPSYVNDAAYGLYFFSVFLGTFNMIPVLPFDGSKIWNWSKPVYITMLAAAGLLFYLALAGF